MWRKVFDGTKKGGKRRLHFRYSPDTQQIEIMGAGGLEVINLADYQSPPNEIAPIGRNDTVTERADESQAQRKKSAA